MKSRSDHAKLCINYIEHELEILRTHVGHLDSFERIIKRFINKRDALKTILTNPAFNINFTYDEMLKFKYQYEILEELLKGVE